MKNQIMTNAEPFYLPGNEVGILLIHGFTGAPTEMKYLANYLNQMGYTVLVPRLFAHGTNVADMNRAHWEDWVASVEDGYYMLKTGCKKIVIAGLSMGGALSLYAGSYLDVDAVIAMAAPFGSISSIANKHLIPFLKIISFFKPYNRYKPVLGDGWFKPENAKDNVSYIGFTPLAGAYELDQLLQISKEEISKIQAPTQLIYSESDQTVPINHMKQIEEVVGDAIKSKIILEKSGHVIPMDGEREKVFEKIKEFLDEVL
jgi:carboxylesterase